ncbi:MAG: hypothetical protein ABIP14_01115 [Blastocatellia bacterium]
MNFEEFEASLADAHPPAILSPYLTALWYDRQGDWNRAHKIIQELNTDTAARIHAYLHRKEGDESNAGYWYRTAKQSFPSGQTLDEEWEALIKELP